MTIVGVQNIEDWSDEEIEIRDKLWEEFFEIIDTAFKASIKASGLGTLEGADVLQMMVDQYAQKRELKGYRQALIDHGIAIPDDLEKELVPYVE